MGIFQKFLQSIKTKIISGFYGTGAGAAASLWSKDAYEQETIRGIIDCIATHTAKAQALHVVVDKDDRIKEIKRNSIYTKLLNQSPNPFMSGFDFKYKITAQMELRTTAIVYIKWNGTKPEQFIPIPYRSFDFYQIQGGGYAVRIWDIDGDEILLNLEDLIILRKFYNENEIAGDGIAPIYNTLNMVKAADEGFSNALTIANKIRGLYKTKKAMLAQEDVEEGQKKFEERLEKAAEKGGIVALDSMEDYVPLTVTPYSANAAQTREIKDNLYTFWRTPEHVVKSNYTEQQGQAWHESVVEPNWLKLGEAFTKACFTQTERDYGNRILFTGSMLMGTSIQTRVNIITVSKETGLLTVNEQRELFGYAPVEGGDKRQVSLNFVNAENQDAYQVGKEDQTDETGEKGNQDAPV